MSAPIPVTPSAGGDLRPHEPSMEEILASIRRIIADDQSLPGRGLPEQEPAPSPAPAATVHVLHGDEGTAEAEPARETPEAVMIAQGTVSAPQFVGPEGPAAVPPAEPVRAERSDDHAAPTGDSMSEIAQSFVGHAPEGASPVPTSPPPTLISTATNSAVSSAFNVLAASRIADNSTELLGLTREMIRPLLQTWLDDNLPALVERLVRDEIERVARGGR